MLTGTRALLRTNPAAARAAASSMGLLGGRGARSKHTLPELSYDYKALEPVISGEIMEIHHSKHHATYVNNLNAAEEQLKQATESGDVSGMIAIQGAVKFNGGGHLNHSIFWKNLSPSGGGAPKGALQDAIKRDFGSIDEFRSQMSAKTIAIQGSGWGWLGYDSNRKQLVISTCSNQDPLKATTGLTPLLGIDVWEHAYYLQYRNVRPDYVKAVWNVVNWDDVGQRYNDACGGGN